MNKRSVRIAAAFAMALMAGGCGDPFDGKRGAEIPEEARAAYVVKAGMPREKVERVLGAPAGLSTTKEGLPFAQYKVGTRVRSVVYDRKNRVVEVYP